MRTWLPDIGLKEQTKPLTYANKTRTCPPASLGRSTVPGPTAWLGKRGGGLAPVHLLSRPPCASSPVQVSQTPGSLPADPSSLVERRKHQKMPSDHTSTLGRKSFLLIFHTHQITEVRQSKTNTTSCTHTHTHTATAGCALYVR